MKSSTEWAIEDDDGELLIELPPGLLEAVGWKPGDEIVWSMLDDTTAVVRLKDALG